MKTLNLSGIVQGSICGSIIGVDSSYASRRDSLSSDMTSLATPDDSRVLTLAEQIIAALPERIKVRDSINVSNTQRGFIFMLGNWVLVLFQLVLCIY